MALVSYGVRSDIALITLNAPERLNAIGAAMAGEIQSSLVRAEAESRAVLITGRGRAFCTGADLADLPLAQLESEGRASLVREALESHLNPVVRALRNLAIPSVVAINGIAAGGGIGLALAGDIILASFDAVLVPLFSPQLALVPDMGVSGCLARMGRGRAMAAALLGEPISAEEAERLGLIYKALPGDQLPQSAFAMARRLAPGPAMALIAARKTLDDAWSLGFEDQLGRETEAQATAAAHPDFAEGLAAFTDRRTPRFV